MLIKSLRALWSTFPVPCSYKNTPHSMASKKPKRTHAMTAPASAKQAVFDNYDLVVEVCMFLSLKSSRRLMCTSRHFRNFVALLIEHGANILPVKNIDDRIAMKFSEWLARANCNKIAWITSRSLVSERRLHMEVALDEASLQQVEDNLADFSCIRHLTVRNTETTWLPGILERVAQGNVTHLRIFLFSGERGIKIKDQKSAFESIESCLSQSRSLSWLEFGRCSLVINSTLVDYLVDGVLKCPTLTRLDLSRILFDQTDLDGCMYYISHLFLAPSSLTYLNLHNQGLDYDCIVRLSSAMKASNRSKCLVELDLTENEINDEAAVVLADAIIEAQTLQSLDICGNRLEDQGSMALVSIAQHSPAFKTLSLDGWGMHEERARQIAAALLEASNTFETLTIECLEISLQNLDSRSKETCLSYSRCFDFPSLSVLRIISELLPHRRALTHLDLSNNNTLELDAYTILGQGIGNSRSLTTVNLYSCNCGDAIFQFVSGVQLCPTLTKLNLSENNIRNDGAKHLASWLRESKTMLSVDLSYNKIDDEGARILADAIVEGQTLQRLWIEHNPMGHIGSNVLVLATKSPALTELWLAEKSITEECAIKIAEALVANKTFKSLHVGCGGIPVQDVVGHTRATKLDFSGEQVDCTSTLRIMGRLMAHNTTLTFLDLSSNTNITPDGYAAIGRGVATNHSLTGLNLADNGCGEEGAIAMVAAGAPQNKTLTSLNLSENDIGDKGAAAVATWIQKTQVLAHLTLCFNHIDLEGALALAEALPKNRSLISLDLWGNALGGEPGARALATAIKKSPMIERVRLDALLLPIKDLREETEFTLAYYCDEYLGYFDLILLTSVMTQCTSLTLIGDSVSNDEEFLVMAVVEATKQCKYLKKMEFHSNYLSDKNAEIVVRAVADHAALETLYFGCMELPIQDLCNRTSETTLDFSSSDITFPSIRHESTIKVLGDLLARNTTATHLSLSSNPGIADWKAIIQGFKSNTSLKSVDLSNINCDAETIIGLSRAFKGNMVLTELDLNCNAIVDEGAAAVATWIEEGACLKKLILSYNQIGNVGAIALAESIKKTGVLDYLDLDENCIEDDGVLALVQRSGESLQYLNLDENPYGEIGSAARRAVYGNHSSSSEEDE